MERIEAGLQQPFFNYPPRAGDEQATGPSGPMGKTQKALRFGGLHH